jgi:hypothetical protein
VPTSLPALCDDDINSLVGCPPGFFCARDRVENDSIGVVNPFDVTGWIAPEQRHNPQTGFEGLVESTVLIRVQDEIPSEWTVGERRCLTNHVSGGSGPRQRQCAEAPGIRDGCRQFGYRRHRRLDDGLFNVEQLTDRRSQRYHLPFRLAGPASLVQAYDMQL